MLIKRVEEFKLKPWLKESKIQLIVLIALAIIAYAGTLNYEFLSDDIFGIVDNPMIGEWANITNSFPIIVQPIIYFFITNIFGKIPAPFRLVNIFFHLGIVLTSYLLVYLLHKQTTAFVAAMLMAVHPIIIESVTWISGGTYTLYGFFVLVAFLFFIFGYKNQKFYFLSIISFIIAFTSSLHAIIYPLILTAFLLFWPESNFKLEWKKLILPWLIGGVMIAFSTMQVGGRLETLQADYYQTPTTMNPLRQIPTAIPKYLELIFWPERLTLYQTEINFLSSAGFVQFAFVFGVFALIGLSTFFINKKLFFWFTFFGIALGPTLTPLGISWLVAERYSRIAVLGMFVLFGWILSKINEIDKIKNIPLILFLTIIVPLLTLRTIVRNSDWQNQDTLWLASAKWSPNSAQNNNNLGDLYARHGDFEKSIFHFERAIKIRPNYADAYHNMANVYWRIGNLESAIENYEKAKEFNPRIWQTRHNLGILYFETGDHQKGIEYMQSAADLFPTNPDIYHGLASMYNQIGEEEKAAEAAAKFQQFSQP